MIEKQDSAGNQYLRHEMSIRMGNAASCFEDEPDQVKDHLRTGRLVRT